MSNEVRGVSTTVFMAGLVVAILVSSALSTVIATQLAVGAQGPKGDTGATGATGAQGEQGPSGPNQIVAMGTYHFSSGVTTAYNIESIVWNSDWNQYFVTFSDGIEYHSYQYVTVVTCFGGFSAGYAGFGSQGNALSIEIYDSNGNQIQTNIGSFSFVVLETPG